MTMSALFELFVALLGVASTCYLVYAYCQFIKEEPARLRRVFAFGEIYYIMKLIKIEECLYV